MNRSLSANRESTQMLINGDRYLRALQPTEASPPAPLRMERGVITEIPLHVLQMFSGPFPISSRLIGVTSHTTPLSIRRGAGGEASVNSVCRRRSVGSKCAPKGSVNSVRSVREKISNMREWNVFCERKNSPATLKHPFSYSGCVLFLTEEHRWTEHTKFHRDVKSTDITERYSQQKPHPQPLSDWRGEWSSRLPLLRYLCRDGDIYSSISFL